MRDEDPNIFHKETLRCSFKSQYKHNQVRLEKLFEFRTWTATTSMDKMFSSSFQYVPSSSDIYSGYKSAFMSITARHSWVLLCNVISINPSALSILRLVLQY